MDAQQRAAVHVQINVDNDEVYVKQDVSGQWYWVRVDASNGRAVSRSSESYVRADYCTAAAQAYNPGVAVIGPGVG